MELIVSISKTFKQPVGTLVPRNDEPFISAQAQLTPELRSKYFRLAREKHSSRTFGKAFIYTSNMAISAVS